MLIDRTHRGWAIASGLIFIGASLLYGVYARAWPSGPSGRTWPGMWFGIVGTLMMVFAGTLAVRKKTVRSRIGNLAWWLRGHIWIGSLSVPFVLFHAAFRWGGWLENALWLVLAIVIVSGIFGLVLQNLLPRSMKFQLSEEAIPDQFGEVRRRLVQAADEKVIELCTPAIMQAAIAAGNGSANGTSDSPLARLASMHVYTVRPYLGALAAVDPRLANSEQAQLMFDQIRGSLPDNCRATVDRLEQLCQERRQLARQERLYRLLHAWLKIHVPFSIVLFVLTAVHVVASLYY